MTAPLPADARVLLIRLSALGDVLFALETVASLARERPDVRIDFLVEDRFADLLRGHPQLHAVHVFPRRRKLAVPAALRALRRTRYDAVLDLHGISKSALHVLAARARRKLGYDAPAAREGAHRLYRERVALPQPLPHRAERGLFLLRALGLAAEPARPVLAPPDAPPSFWRQDDRPRVVLHPGASAFAAFKRWPADRFAALAGRLRARGLVPAVSFGPGEEELARAIADAAPGCRLLDGRGLGLRGLGAVLADADLVVAADTGPLHLAAAAGCAAVALFGPRTSPCAVRAPPGRRCCSPTCCAARASCAPARRRSACSASRSARSSARWPSCCSGVPSQPRALPWAPVRPGPIPTTVIRHPKERISKCSLRHLHQRADVTFLKATKGFRFDASGFTLLAVDGPPLTAADAGRPLLLLDSTWRYLPELVRCLDGAPVRRSIPPGVRTAYPRHSRLFADPEGGLASVEALYVARRILGDDDPTLLDGYHFAQRFLALLAAVDA